MLRSLLLRASRSRWLEGQVQRRGFARRAVRRFMPGEDLGSALAGARELAGAGIPTVLTRLGEEVGTGAEAEAVTAHYLDVLARIAEEDLDCQISVKPTQLGLSTDRRAAEANLLRLVGRAAEVGNTVWIDMEGSEYTDATLDLARAAAAASNSAGRVGVCVQAYLRRTPADLESLRDPPLRIRLVKGAYREPAEIAYTRRREVDEAYLRLARRLLADPAWLREAPPAWGTHDTSLLERLRESEGGPGGAGTTGGSPLVGAEDGAPRPEVQMLYGIRADEQRRLVAAGEPVRVLISYGPAWYPWFVRRLAERPANLWFVVRNLAG